MPTPVVHDSFTIERRYPHPPTKLFRTLSEQALKARWFAAGRNAFEVFEVDFTVGGRDYAVYRLGADTPFPGAMIENVGRHEDIVPGERIVISTTTVFAGKRISTALVTYEIGADEGGCTLRLTHQCVFYEGADGPQMRRGGWETLLDTLGDTLGEALAE